jgi:hypothetical protein
MDLTLFISIIHSPLVMWNEGIDVLGFAGDTMHMARLEDTSRARVDAMGNGGTGYSLEALTNEILGRRKRPMKEIFGVKRLRKDGSEGSLVDLPPIELLQRDPTYRTKWIEYSCYDAQGTWLLYSKLKERLQGIPWMTGYTLFDYYETHMRPFANVLTDMERRGIRVDAHDYLAGVERQARLDRKHHLEVFRNWASTKIGPDGLALNPASSVQLSTLLFGGAKNSKTGEATERVRVFKVPREEVPEQALEGYLELENASKQDSGDADKEEDSLAYLETMKAVQLKALCKEQGLKVAGKKAELQDRLREHFFSLAAMATASPDDGLDAMSEDDLRHALISRGIPANGLSRDELLAQYRQDEEFTKEVKTAMDSGYMALSKVLEQAEKEGGVIAEYLNDVKEKSQQIPKFVDVTVTSLGMRPEKYTVGGAPSCTSDVIRKLAGDPFADPPIYGTAFDTVGKDGCEALASLGAIGSIDTMIANFLTSLQELADADSRVHCSLNLNTETGRLSSRRPNLQNQPALEKDKYKIRKAFQASPGNNLIVADYGQLELRILASITGCKSMIDAFDSGGDFHSRTAIGTCPLLLLLLSRMFKKSLSLTLSFLLLLLLHQTCSHTSRKLSTRENACSSGTTTRVIHPSHS